MLSVLRVFCAADGAGGNALGVFLDGAEVPEGRRQAVAAELGFAETVFVDDRERGELRIFTPGVELPLAGHPLVGTAWLLRERGRAPSVLRPPAGEVEVRFERELTMIAADPGWGPEFEFTELGGPDEVEAAPVPDAGPSACVWAWLDRDAGRVRSRVFLPEAGITEDEATGSAALRLTTALGRPLEIDQGRGSVLLARPIAADRAEVGGRVELDELRSAPAGGAW